MQQSKTRIVASFGLQEKHDVARDKSVLPEMPFSGTRMCYSMPATVCVSIQPISPGRREGECHGRFRSPSDNYRASQDQDRQSMLHRRIPDSYYLTRLQKSNSYSCSPRKIDYGQGPRYSYA